MPYRLPITLTLLLLAGCGGLPRTVIETDVEVCPPKKPAMECPAMPDGGETLRDLLRAWQDAVLVHAQCREAVRVWDQAWTACRLK